MKILKANKKDARKISKMIIKEVSKFKEFSMSEIASLKKHYNQKRLIKRMEEASFYIVTKDSKIIGVMGLGASNVESSYIKEGHQRKGIGGKLLAHLEKQATKNGSRFLTLLASKSSLAFWRKEGYSPVKKIHDELGEATLMIKYLK